MNKTLSLYTLLRHARRGLAPTLLVLAAGGGSGLALAAADLIVVNGDVRTVDPGQPRAEAFAVEAGRFTAIGSEEEVRILADDATKVIDAGGATVMPGLIDGHTHLALGTDYVTGVNLYAVPDKTTWLERIAAADAHLAEGSWLTGGGWDHTLGDGELPTKEDLDAVVPDRPVALRDIDFHSLWVNSKALELAGITADTPVPPGGEIVIDPDTGEPTGLLLEGAANLVLQHEGLEQSETERLAALEETVRYANSLGITGVHDMGDIAGAYDYLALADAGQLPLRVWYGFYADDPATIDAAVEDRTRIAEGIAATGEVERRGPLLALGYAKGMIDGVLSTRTALLLDAYADKHGWHGEPFHSADDLTGMIEAANTHGFAAAVHAIGDGGVRMTLDAFAEGARPVEQPNRLEHIEVIADADVQRLAEQGLVASMQPNHATGTIGKYITDRLGEPREANAYVWQAMLEHGVPLVLGSDWPTSPLSPLTQFGDAVFRESPFGLGDGPWHPEQSLAFDEALHAYTQAGADMTPWGGEIGSISVGKWADFVILDGRLPQPLDRSIRERSVEATYLAGQVAYRRNRE